PGRRHGRQGLARRARREHGLGPAPSSAQGGRLPAAPRLAEPGPAPRPRRGATGARGLGARGTGGREPALPAEEPRLRPLRGRPDREDLRRARGAPRGHPAGTDLARTDLDELEQRLEALHRDREDLTTLPRRTELLRRLELDGLGELVEDLRLRRVSADQVGPELELSWWRSVLELIAGAEPTISQYDGTSLSQVAERFRRLDAQHLDNASARVHAAADGGSRGEPAAATASTLSGGAATALLGARSRSLCPTTHRPPRAAAGLPSLPECSALSGSPPNSSPTGACPALEFASVGWCL